MAVDQDDLARLAIAYLERQHWYSGAAEPAPPAHAEVVAARTIREERPGLARLVVGAGTRRFQVLVGWRDPSELSTVLRGRESAILGPVSDGPDQVLAYDAVADDELLVELLAHVTGGRERATLVRRVPSLDSHASVVYDERLFMKCYRVLDRGARPEVEVVLGLDRVGFNALLAPVAHWREDGLDLAIVREFLPGALEGRLLALTSLRDLLAHASGREEGASSDGGPDAGGAPVVADPEDECASAGGDLASEMARLGATTARLHLALSEAFGDRPASASTVEDAASALGGARGEGATEVAERVASVDPGAAGRSIRLHGDYHLRRVMRSEVGWLVAGFGDDPLYGASEGEVSRPGRRGSPVEDLADMCNSVHRVAEEALAQRPGSETPLASELARAWERRNRSAFLEGYAATEGVGRLLPRDPSVTELLLSAHELARERRYEATSPDT
ncbi:MAG: hypothetical protein M0Z33_01490 [Actinomycetota bacterium]|nr:hypothetical protein [Actinomycetota bacterium]